MEKQEGNGNSRMGLCHCPYHRAVCPAFRDLDNRKSRSETVRMAGANLKMHEKKAFAGLPIPIILGIIVILLVSGGLLWGTGKGIAQKIFGERGAIPLIPGQQEFVPYKMQISAEEKEVLTSMNALICGLNIVGLGKYDRFEEACPALKEKVPTAPASPSVAAVADLSLAGSECDFKYEDKCIKCVSSEYVVKDLPTKKDAALKALVEATAGCFRKYEKNNKQAAWCSQFVIPKDFEGTITETEFRDALFKYGGELGSDIAGTNIGITITGENYEWNDDISTKLNSVYLCADTDLQTADIEIFAPGPGKNLGTMCPKTSSQLAKDRASIDCHVTGFNLPQKTGDAAFLDPENWLSAYGDPNWITYYESFPAGEETAWQIDPLEASLYTAAAFSLAAPALGKIVSVGAKALKAVGSLFGRVLSVVPGMKLIAMLGKGGYYATKYVLGLPFRMARTILYGGAKIIGVSGKKIIYEISPTFYVKMFSNTERLMKYVPAKKFEEVFGKKWTQELAEKLYKLDDVAPKVVNVFKKAKPDDLAKVFTKTEIEGIEKALAKGDHEALLDIAKTSLINKGQPNFLGQEAAQTLESAFGKDAAPSIADALAAKETLDLTDELLKNQDIVTAQSAFMDRMKIWSPANYDLLARLGPKYAFAVSAGMAAMLADSLEKKFESVGVNKIAIRAPYEQTMISGEYFMDLHPELKKYYLAVIRDKSETFFVESLGLDQAPARFFLASPCVANLEVFKTKCQCVYNSELKEQAEIVDFGAGAMPVMTASINPQAADPAKRYAYAVKECDAMDNLADPDAAIKGDIYVPECIGVTPTVLNNTFCYSGIHALAEAGKWGVVAGNVGAAIALEAGADALAASTLGIGLVPAKIAQYAITFGVDILSAWFEHMIVKTTKWPNH